MKSFSERSPLIIGVVSVALVAIVVGGALQYKKLPFFDSGRRYSAYFSEAGGLTEGAPVQIAGYKVGEVSSVRLEGPKVLVDFKVNKSIRLGDRTEASVKTKSLLGAKILEIIPRGANTLSGAIPLDRTRPAYQLPDALGDLAKTVSGLNTQDLNASLQTLAGTFKDTPPDLQAAVQGVARFSETLDQRDAQLRGLLENANKVTSVLAKRTDQIVGLIGDTNALLVQLHTQSAALEHISSNITYLTQQISGFINDNRKTLKPSLDKLNGVLQLLNNHKADLQKSITMLNRYALSLGESVGSGPFFKAYLSNLLPGQFVQPFVDAAFSDLGLDPNTLLPSQRIDPPVGQRATPPLPMPYPRTGQGGPPRLNLPDAITGNPGDPGCGPPGIPLPGPTGCYPYRDPGPAPARGGPPPGPPASPQIPNIAVPTPSPVYVPAPGEVAGPSGNVPTGGAP